MDSVNMIPKSMRLLARREGEAEKKLQKAGAADKDWQDSNDWSKGKGKAKDWWGKGKDGKKPWYPKDWKKAKGKGKKS